jgi:phospholipid/cholesterol/gamma-HCH transport system substrate-binding protein
MAPAEAERSEEEGQEESRFRTVTLAAVVVVAAVGVAWVLLRGDAYTVTANFQNASQLVEGNDVAVAGTPAGSVEEIELAPDNTALVTFTVDDQFAPLPEGTKAQVNSFSLSSIANNQVELTLPPDEGVEPIADGGRIDQSDTIANVDLDELFNTLDDRTVRNLKKVIKGFEISYDGVGKQANKGFRYLNPFLSTSRRFFGELNRDERALERLIVDGSQLAGAVAERAPDLEQLIGNLNRFQGALARQKQSLADAVAKFPNFMRSANTTFVNLRAALDDVDPLVDASKPVAIRLRPFFREFRGAARGAVPTIRDLDELVLRPGKNNDLVDFTRLQPDVAEIAIGPVRRNGAERAGAFPETAESLEASLPQLAFLRPYTPELVGWFDDFSHSGFWDANGGFARQSIIFNAFTFDANTGLPETLIPFEDRGELFKEFASIDNLERCPGSLERDRGDGSVPFIPGGTEDPFQPEGRLDCDPEDAAVGP